MTYPVTRHVRHCLRASALALAAVGVACGGGTVSTRTAVDSFNRVAEARQVRIMCPDEIDRSMKEFECTLQGTQTGKTAKVKMEAISDEDDFLDTADGPAFRSAVEQVTQP